MPSKDWPGFINTKMIIYHILVKHEYEAQDILKKIKVFEDFQKCAEKFSLCPSGKQGGLLGPFKKNRFVNSFEEAVEELPENKISKPVRTQFGYHLIWKK